MPEPERPPAEPSAVHPPARPHDRARDEELRAASLAGLLPPLVHRLNNSLAVLQGVHELGERAGAEERELARVHLAHLALVLARLGLFAREPSAYARRLALAELETGLALLVVPLAESRGVTLDVAFEAGGVLEVDERFEGLVISAACELVAGRRAESGPRPRVHVVARARGGVLALALGSSAAPLQATPALDGLAEHARARGWPVERRSAARAVALRLAVPAAELVARVPRAREARRVLLLARAGEERELVEMLLREHGFGVVAAHEPPARGTFDLALVEARLADAAPELTARLPGVRVVRFEPNPRPEEILRLVGGR